MEITELENIAEFLNGVDGITVVSDDYPLEGIKCFNVFKNNSDDFSLNLQAKMHNKAEVIYLTTDDDFVSNSELLESCLEGDGWIKCDDAKNLKLGFLKPSKMEASRAVMLGLPFLRDSSNKEWFDKVVEWRMEKGERKVKRRLDNSSLRRYNRNISFEI